MLTPPGFPDYESYLRAGLDYLHDYAWAYNFPVTQILVRRVLEDIPSDWSVVLLALTNEELNQLPHGLTKADWPSGLQDFLQRSRRLRLELPVCPNDGTTLPASLCHGLGPKKRHEVTRLAHLVHQECSAHNICSVLDLGSGLGYLGQVLHQLHGYRVLGLDVDPARVKTANLRRRNLCSSDHVSYVACNVCRDSSGVVQRALCDAFRSDDPCCCGRYTGRLIQGDVVTDRTAGGKDVSLPEICVVGLHACGDLAVAAGRLFREIQSLKLMILMPCCYHRMALRVAEDDARSNPSQETSTAELNTVVHPSVEHCVSIGSHVTHGSPLHSHGINSRDSICLQSIEGQGFPHAFTQTTSTKETCDDAHQSKCIVELCSDLSGSAVLPPRLPCPTMSARLCKEEAEFFYCFPASSVLQQLCGVTADSGQFLRRPLLRLASQETSSRWQHMTKEQHSSHSLHVMARAVLELLASQENLTLTKRRRRAVRRCNMSSFDPFLDDLLGHYNLVAPDGNCRGSSVRQQMVQLWAQHGGLCRLSEVLTALQVTMQAAVEHLVLADRACSLEPWSCRLVQVMDDQLSPRSLALLATKQAEPCGTS